MNTSRAVLIKGGGMAACCCAALLQKAGYHVHVDLPLRSASPVIMLSEQTQLILSDVFGAAEFLEGATPISQRVVKWGENTEPVVLPHSGLVISESSLLERLWRTVPKQGGECDSWRVISHKASLPYFEQHDFGSRTAWTNRVSTRNSESCWVESTKSGWLFLIPGSLISVGQRPEVLLAESQLVSQQLIDLGESAGSFAAFPKVITPLGGSGWIACGSAALAFDPIAGEGAGNALREGILAAAVIQAVDSGEAEDDLLAHYTNRLMRGFLRHLTDCCRFYQALPGPWWESELCLLRKGVEWTQRYLAVKPPGVFRLQGFELQRGA